MMLDRERERERERERGKLSDTESRQHLIETESTADPPPPE
mgnify:CR=1 FL=1